MDRHGFAPAFPLARRLTSARKSLQSIFPKEDRCSIRLARARVSPNPRAVSRCGHFEWALTEIRRVACDLLYPVRQFAAASARLLKRRHPHSLS